MLGHRPDCPWALQTVSYAGSDRPPAPTWLAVSALLGVPIPGGPPRAAPAPPPAPEPDPEALAAQVLSSNFKVGLSQEEVDALLNGM